MSRGSKFIKSPGLFFRDFFLKRYPLNHIHNSSEALAIHSEPHEPEFPIDIVMTWVDNTDASWQQQFRHYHNARKKLIPSSASPARFATHSELKYALRGIERYMPWVRHIYIVVGQEGPAWLRPNERLTLVPHSDIIADRYLPTFNSHVIEAHLHKIPGLAEHYLYFNDDVFPFRSLRKSDFFTANGLANLFFDQDKPIGKALQADTPTGFALRNAAAFMQQRYRDDLPFVPSHIVFPQLKSLNQTIFNHIEEQRRGFFEERFRSPRDLAIPSQLHNFCAYRERLGIARTIPYSYFNVRSRAARLNYQLLRTSQAAPPYLICLNDNDCRQEWENWEEHLIEFMETAFPWPSSFERPAANRRNDAVPSRIKDVELFRDSVVELRSR